MTALGDRVVLSKTPVTARVKRLVDEGIITGYRATLSVSKLDFEHIAGCLIPFSGANVCVHIT